MLHTQPTIPNDAQCAEYNYFGTSMRIASTVTVFAYYLGRQVTSYFVGTLAGSLRWLEDRNRDTQDRSLYDYVITAAEERDNNANRPLQDTDTNRVSRDRLPELLGGLSLAFIPLAYFTSPVIAALFHAPYFFGYPPLADDIINPLFRERNQESQLSPSLSPQEQTILTDQAHVEETELTFSNTDTSQYVIPSPSQNSITNSESVLSQHQTPVFTALPVIQHLI